MSNERARQTGNFYMGNNNLEVPKNPFADGAEKVREDQRAKELQERLKEAHLEKQKEIEERLVGLEVVPNGQRIILMPYPTNPYVKIMTESGIYTQPTGTFMNPDSGTLDTMEEITVCAKVIEVGPDCKSIQIGDDVYYDKRTAYPLPFMGLGYQVSSESQIIAIINNNLKERLGMVNG